MSKLIPNQPDEQMPEELYDQLELFDMGSDDDYALIESTEEEFLAWLSLGE